MNKKKRWCIDCKRLISDKRSKLYTIGTVCPSCREEHHRQRKQEWWVLNRDRVKNRRKRKAGGVTGKKYDLQIAKVLRKHQLFSGFMLEVTLSYGKKIYFHDMRYRKSADPHNILPKTLENGEPRFIEDVMEIYGDNNVKILPKTRH